jgi:probable phosphoglycerate mutase
VVSDSELMVNQMKGRYKVASPGLRPLWEEAKCRAARLERFEMRHTLRGGNQEADRLANEAIDKGTGKAAAPVAGAPTGGAVPPRQAAQPKPKTQILEGFVKNGVVHLLEGELPDGIFVKIVRE